MERESRHSFTILHDTEEGIRGGSIFPGILNLGA
jgi:hypothetical protein